MKNHRGFVLSLMVLLLPAMSFSQTGTSSIRGTIVDPQNNVVPNASVTITNLATNATRTQKSGSAGTYSFDFVTPGDYRVEAEAQGFRKTVAASVHALID